MEKIGIGPSITPQVHLQIPLWPSIDSSFGLRGKASGRQHGHASFMDTTHLLHARRWLCQGGPPMIDGLVTSCSSAWPASRQQRCNLCPCLGPVFRASCQREAQQGLRCPCIVQLQAADARLERLLCDGCSPGCILPTLQLAAEALQEAV